MNTETTTEPPGTATAPEKGDWRSTTCSRRADLLSQDARDILAWAFREGFSASELAPMPMNAVEVKISGDVDAIMVGGDNFRRHGGSDSERYYTHRDDEDWALVFAHDCDGCADRGEKFARSYSPANAQGQSPAAGGEAATLNQPLK